MKPESYLEKLLNWVRLYYFGVIALIFIFGLKKFFNLDHSFVPVDSYLDPIYKIWSFKLLSSINAILIMLVGLFLVKSPKNQTLRVLLFFCFLIFEEQINSIGAKTHLFQFWLWSSLGLALVPTLKKQEIEFKIKNLELGIWAAGSIILCMYFLSGLWKLIGVFIQLLANEPHLLTRDGLTYHVYSEVLRANANPIAMNFLKSQSWINPILSLGVIFIQIGAILGVFNLKFWKPLGFFLLSFHFGTLLILDITYPTNFLLVGIVFLLNPLRVPHTYKIFGKV